MQAFSYKFEDLSYDPGMPTGRPAKKIATKFGQRLQAARSEVGLTQRELAERVGVTQRVIAYWERESVGLKADQLTALADALGTSIDSLIGRTTEAKRRGGPVGRARRLFDDINALPRGQRQQVLDMVETILAGQMARRERS